VLRLDPFKTRQGLRKGDVLSTLLFNVVLEEMVRPAKLQTTENIFNKQTQYCGTSLEAVCDAYLALEAEAAKLGLKINEQKTKYIIAAGNWTILDAGQIVAFGDKNFEVVNKFVSSCDTEARREVRDTAKNPNCK
jgi:hypothetical protein